MWMKDKSKDKPYVASKARACLNEARNTFTPPGPTYMNEEEKFKCAVLAAIETLIDGQELALDSIGKIIKIGAGT